MICCYDARQCSFEIILQALFRCWWCRRVRCCFHQYHFVVVFFLVYFIFERLSIKTRLVHSNWLYGWVIIKAECLRVRACALQNSKKKKRERERGNNDKYKQMVPDTDCVDESHNTHNNPVLTPCICKCPSSYVEHEFFNGDMDLTHAHRQSITLLV